MKYFPALLLMASFGGVASAATVLQIQTITFNGTPTYSGSGTFNQFNSSLGTLLSITITTGVTSNGGRYSIDNDSPTSGAGTVTLGASVAISSDDVRQATLNAVATTTTTLTVQADDGDMLTYSELGLDSASYSGVEASATELRNVAANFFGDYTGAGTFVVNYQSVQINSSTSFTGIQTQIDPVVSNGFITIQYSYDAIPEPGSALLGGMSMLALLRRRRH